MLFGGGRSGKTLLHVRNTVMRALKAPLSPHLVLRFRFNHVKAAVILDTFPKAMRECFPGVAADVSRTDWYARLPNGSEVWFGGLEDRERMEKVLGLEFSTSFLNESSQSPWPGRHLATKRLDQRSGQAIPGPTPQPLS